MRRRDFIASATFAGVAAAGWPPVGHAQQSGRNYRIGFLVPVARDSPAIVAFLDELRLRGFVEGENLAILPAGFEVRIGQIPEVAAGLVKAAPDVILSGGDLMTSAFQQITRTIPIMVMTEDVIAAGFAASMARPGGNMTGISLMSTELDGKRQEILIEAVPGAQRIAALADSNVGSLKHLEMHAQTARTHGTELLLLRAAKPEDLVRVLEDAKTQGATAVNVLSSPMLYQNRRTIIDRAAALRLPAIYQWPEIAGEGGLLAYGPSFIQIFRQRARMTAKVLSGTSPADLPVEQPAVFELAINLKAAKAIGHEIPVNLMLRADRLIE